MGALNPGGVLQGLQTAARAGWKSEERHGLAAQSNPTVTIGKPVSVICRDKITPPLQEYSSVLYYTKHFA